MSRRRLAALAAVLVLLAIGFVELRTIAPRHGAASTPVGSAPIVSESGRGHAGPTAPSSTEEQALARAYAALGAASDGDDQRLRALDPAARARLDEARRLLEDSPPRANAAPARAEAASPTAMPRVATDSADASTPTAPTTAGTGAVTAPPAAMTLDLGHMVDPRTALRDGAEGPELLEPGLWAKVPFRPDQAPRLVIADRCDGGYAVAFYGGDFSTIRLDGGLVVPGRYYHVHGNAVITGAAPCSVDIRPLAVVPSVAEQPVRPPSSNG